jgi:hypothetical protein
LIPENLFPTGRVNAFNRKGEKVLKLSRKQVLGEDFVDGKPKPYTLNPKPNPKPSSVKTVWMVSILCLSLSCVPNVFLICKNSLSLRLLSLSPYIYYVHICMKTLWPFSPLSFVCLCVWVCMCMRVHVNLCGCMICPCTARSRQAQKNFCPYSAHNIFTRTHAHTHTRTHV